MGFFDISSAYWNSLETLHPKDFTCGYCGNKVSSEKGYFITQRDNSRVIGFLYICPSCQGPVFFTPYSNKQIPGPAIGNPINNLPDDLINIYNESRNCYREGCFTACVMLCRKILMHIAVDKGDNPGKSFVEYIDYLQNTGYIPPNGKKWVDHIRSKGNEANHEIVIMKEDDAKDIIIFTEMLLRFSYEFPAMIP